VNELIAWANAVIAVSMTATGLVFFWQAWKRQCLVEWPPSVLVLLGTVPFLVGICWAQIVMFRLTELDGLFGPNGAGTLAFRWGVAVVVAFRLVRVARGRLLTPADRTRLNGGSG
jgi:hypothetical protein